MNCKNCGAALPSNSAVCRFCQTRNDIDFRGIGDVARRRGEEPRHCPTCRDLLETIDIGGQAPFLIERCGQCLGLFFDRGELDAIVARHESARNVNLARIQSLLGEETPPDFSAVKYVHCPVCHELMHRRSFGARSGVIIDECRDHGVWLDGGELRRILTWAKAGGRQHDLRKELDDARHQLSLERMKPVESPLTEVRVRTGLDFVSVIVDLLRIFAAERR